MSTGLWRRKAKRLNLKKLPVDQSFNDKTLILLPDSFNASFGSEVVLAAYDLLEHLGYQVLVAPVLDNGKAVWKQNHGFVVKRLIDRFFVNLEDLSRVARVMPILANLLLHNRFSLVLLKSLVHFVSPPRLSASMSTGLWRRKAKRLNLKKLPVDQSFNDKTLILLPDSFNASFGSEVVLAAYDLLEHLGYQVLVAPVLDNGKALHVMGFRKEFKRRANRHVRRVRLLASIGLPLISIEVVTRLMHEKEYAENLSL